MLTDEAHEARRRQAEDLPTASRPAPERMASSGGLTACSTAPDTPTLPELPANALEARATFDLELYNLQRIYMANRGIWEAIDSAGPACGAQTSGAHVDRYLEVLGDFLDELAHRA